MKIADTMMSSGMVVIMINDGDNNSNHLVIIQNEGKKII